MVIYKEIQKRLAINNIEKPTYKTPKQKACLFLQENASLFLSMI